MHFIIYITYSDGINWVKRQITNEVIPNIGDILTLYGRPVKIRITGRKIIYLDKEIILEGVLV